MLLLFLNNNTSLILFCFFPLVLYFLLSMALISKIDSNNFCSNDNCSFYCLNLFSSLRNLWNRNRHLLGAGTTFPLPIEDRSHRTYLLYRRTVRRSIFVRRTEYPSSVRIPEWLCTIP